MQGQVELAERPQKDQNVLQSATNICQSMRLAQMSSLLLLSKEGSVVCLEWDKVVHVCLLLLENEITLIVPARA